ncbi:MAG: M48 family metalloprotease [Gammaproteobacteria bacterium]|nr:M48 family metalloprotease [Gammaproteobacteria bacterium]MCH9763179.1 M48 family metalloprotease [Gammaproteobacteria bacterium]
MTQWIPRKTPIKRQHQRFRLILLSVFLLIKPSFAFSPYSNSELDELEKEFIQQINNSSSILRDPLTDQYINRLGQQLSAQTDVSPPPDFFIVKSNEINAFAGPGGHIGIHSTLLLMSDHESELAAVMAHEIAHVRQHHLYRMIEHQHHMKVPMLASLLAGIALGAINPALGQGAVMAALGGFAQDSINFIRSNEKEADRIGMDMLKRAGFDPRGMIQFFKRMQENTRYYSANVPAILRTHPLDDDRIAEAEHRLVNTAHQPIKENLNYQLAKERIRNLTSKQHKKLLDTYNSRCPTLETNDNPCLYGRALTLLYSNQTQKAYDIFQSLAAENRDNLFYSIALAEAETKLKKNTDAITRLLALLENHPENYALIMALSNAYSAANQTHHAAQTLLQAHRTFPRDLPVCYALARAASDDHQKAHAYFTYAECHALQGNTKEARRLFKLAKTLSTKDRFLQARIAAKLDEIKFNK